MLDIGFNFQRGGGVNLGMTSSLMELQSDLWRQNTEWFNKNGYKFLREGLVNADYNPILAIGSSPLNGEMPTAIAQNDTVSRGFNMTPSANMQAATARKISDSQIMVNKATASKVAEEALTQENVRNNLDSQSLLNLLQSERIQKLLPYDVQKAVAEIAVLNSTRDLNYVTAQYVPYNAESTRISANANDKNAETNAQWTPAKVASGALAGLLGTVGLGKFGKVAKPFMKNSKIVQKALGTNSYRSSSAKYFTTLH